MARGQRFIEQITAIIAMDPADNTEGVVGRHTPAGVIPMIAADDAKVRQLLPNAQFMANASGMRMELVRFKQRKHVSWIEPEGTPGEIERDWKDPNTIGLTQGSEPPPPGATDRSSVQPFDQIQMHETVPAQGVIVAATMTPDGRPGIALSFEINGEWTPPIGLAGEQAEDVGPLADQALRMARSQRHGGN